MEKETHVCRVSIDSTDPFPKRSMNEKQAKSQDQNDKYQSTHDIKWFKRLQEMSDFKHSEGHCRVPVNFKHNPSLGKWVRTQREQYKNIKQGKKSSLTKDRLKALDKIGFVWSVNKTVFQSTWMDYFVKLKEFKDRNNHCRVPQNVSENPSLGRWVAAQRRKYKRMKQGGEESQHKITNERIRLLNAIGFVWDVSEDTGELWMTRYEDLKFFKEREGHCCVPRS